MPIKFLKKTAQFALADGGSIKARVLRSSIWVGLSEIGLQVLGLARSIALARLLTPEMFGLMGLAMIVIRAVETFTRPGVAQALIARQQSFQEAASTAFTMLVLRGVLLAALLAVAAPFVARFYEREELAAILWALSLLFVIGGFANINTIAHQKELDFRRLSYLNQATTLIGTIVTVGVAYVERSVWALVVGQLVTAALSAVLSYVFVGGRMRFAFDREIVRDLLSYGKFVTGSSVLLFIATELDSAVIGKILGAEQLGYYTLAFTLAHLVTANFAKLASSVMMPAYAKLQTDPVALRAAFLRTLQLVLFIVMPTSAGLIVTAAPLVEVVYGQKWLPSVLLVQLLVIFGLFRSLAAFNGYLFEGIGKPKIAFQLGAIRLAITVPAIVPATYEWGLPGAALTVIVGMVAQWIAGLFHLRSHLQVGVTQIARLATRTFWTSLVMAAVVYVTMSVLGDRMGLALIVGIASGVTVYAVLNLSVLRSLRREGFR